MTRMTSVSSLLISRMVGGLAILVIASYSAPSSAFVVKPVPQALRTTSSSTSRLFSTEQQERSATQDEKDAPQRALVNGDARSSSLPASMTDKDAKEGESEGLPWWWDLIWDLPIMQPGEQGTDVTFGDSARVLKSNIEQIYGDAPSLDGCPLAEGELTDIAEGTMFIGLQQYNNEYGSPYKLCFGPKSFLVVSDAEQAKAILRDQANSYDKGLLGELLEPIMGRGLIPADPVTWKQRRPQIVPAFHKAWLNHMIGLFGHCNKPLFTKLNEATKSGNQKVEMESLFNSVALDIIGLSVFNYDFGSVTTESPVIKAVYSTLVEVEHRSQGMNCLYVSLNLFVGRKSQLSFQFLSKVPAPYWELPLANQLVPRLREFNSNLKLLNDVLDDLIARAKSTRQVTDLEELEARNYDNVDDPSMLRFLVDMRGADIDNKQLRDDLMTMLIAGHETTGALLTWSLFELTRNPEACKKLQKEIDTVMGDRNVATDITYQDIMDMRYLRMVLAETLRLYPEPPLLIRRCREENILPAGSSPDGREATVIRGMDMFLSIYNLHHDERFWPEPEKFDPERFLRPYSNPDVPGWGGFDPTKWQDSKLYPNEIASDFAFLPFGGGARKCVGDEFAMLEACVTLAAVLRDFDFTFDKDYQTPDKIDIYGPPSSLQHPVGMRTGATIHTRNGLHLLVKKRQRD